VDRLKNNLLSCVKEAIEKKKLKEPFDAKDLMAACPGFAEKYYGIFLVHHRKGNPIKLPEIFERNDSGKYTLIKRK
jgi:hypothetical protein